MSTAIDTSKIKPIYFKFDNKVEADNFARECAARPFWDAHFVRVIEVTGKGWAVKTLGDSRFYFMGLSK